MAIADWFSAREKRRYTQMPERSATAGTSGGPEGEWVQCDACKHVTGVAELAESHNVCPRCANHLPVSAPDRVTQIVDDGSFVEIDAELTSCDPLGFVAAKPYGDSLAAGRSKSGLAEAVITGRATIDGMPVVIGAMDFRFIGASMGSVVGEKVTRAFEAATEQGCPIVLVISSGGARMQEGMLSLMQMAKTSAAARRHADAGLAYISVLTNPTYGGVTASFAVLADVILAEPGAMIGFAGPRLVEQTIRQKLPKGFQTAEFMLKHGMVDEVIDRRELGGHLSLLLGYLGAGEAVG